MSESKQTQKFMLFMRARLQEVHGVVFKHSDRYTNGVPDVSLTIYPRGTSWLEMKDINLLNVTLPDMLAMAQGKPLQFHNMKKLSRAMRSAFYVMYGQKSTYITRPEYLEDQRTFFRDLRMMEVPYSIDNVIEQLLDKDGPSVLVTAGLGNTLIWDLCSKERR